ncbi:MAG: nitrate reductase cytochrome c-type subunit [Candidatus Electrothrix sp. AR5]|nr:nitrate reductase cytochrome c-type subunit [Candidatus Electrothrix sp. AR5]
MESIMKRISFPLFLVILIFSFSLAYGEDLQSLRGGADIPAGSVPAVDIDWKPPGSAVARTFIHQPPLIPHNIKGMRITADQNTCMGCHSVEATGAPKPFKTHYTDRDGEKTDHISRRWYFCTQCHVGQVDAPPLVENIYNK